MFVKLLLRLCVPLLLFETSLSLSPSLSSDNNNNKKKNNNQKNVLGNEQRSSLFSSSVYDTIDDGKIAVIPNFLSTFEVNQLREDAQDLYYQEDAFTTDALASYGKKGHFDPTKDRAVLKLRQWNDPTLGAYQHTRKAILEHKMRALRYDLADNLQRPKLLVGDSISKYGHGSTEISYTRFGPGASLARHVDEHHEECKGRNGWVQPTRRSLSWLVYLNDSTYNAQRHGGSLRCYQRKYRMGNDQIVPNGKVGARGTGDLQIGWLKATLRTQYDIPVFMEAQHSQAGQGTGTAKDPAAGVCTMYIEDAHGKKQYISKKFHSNPILYVGGSEYLVAKTIITNPEDAARFRFIELPKSAINDYLYNNNDKRKEEEELVFDIPPTGGTLVVFDSVSLPHAVLPTNQKERWSTSGWMHEDQQSVLL